MHEIFSILYAISMLPLIYFHYASLLAQYCSYKLTFTRFTYSAINAFDSIAQTSAVQGPARSSVAKKEDAHKKENKPAPEETEDVYYSRSTGLPVKYLDISAKSKLQL